MRRLQSVSDNLVLEIQTIDREKFFNYFRMTSELVKELLDYVYIKQEYVILTNKRIIINFLLQGYQILTINNS